MIEDFEKESQKKKDTGKKEESRIKGRVEGEALRDFSLQDILANLEKDPSILKYLSPDIVYEISKKIGNQRFETFLNGGEPLLKAKGPEFDFRETGINDISTETPELIELG